jgi:hypothetical protein
VRGSERVELALLAAVKAEDAVEREEYSAV